MKNKEINNHLPDWQQGNNSELSALERIQLMNEWLENIKKEVIKITKQIPDEIEPVGFIDI